MTHKRQHYLMTHWPNGNDPSMLSIPWWPKKKSPLHQEISRDYGRPSRDMASTKRIIPRWIPEVFPKPTCPPCSEKPFWDLHHSTEAVALRMPEKLKSSPSGNPRRNPEAEAEAEAVFSCNREKDIGPSDVPKFNEDTVDRRNVKQQPLYGCINKTWDKQRDKLPFPQLVKPRRISAINYR